MVELLVGPSIEVSSQSDSRTLPEAGAVQLYQTDRDWLEPPRPAGSPASQVELLVVPLTVTGSAGPRVVLEAN